MYVFAKYRSLSRIVSYCVVGKSLKVRKAFASEDSLGDDSAERKHGQSEVTMFVSILYVLMYKIYNVT